MTRVAVGAAAGVAQSLLWPRAPRYVAVALYVALGWAAAPDAGALAAALPPLAGPLVLGGGVCYTVGALCYAARWPDPAPSTFGYHE
jgi:hemolysin III